MDKEQGNKLIAEFMGMEFDGKSLWSDKKTGKALIFGNYTPHEDWNELMPVVEKIEKIIMPDETYFEVEIFSTTCSITRIDANQEGDVCKVSDNKLKSTWEAIVQFIQWYNLQTPKQ